MATSNNPSSVIYMSKNDHTTLTFSSEHVSCSGSPLRNVNDRSSGAQKTGKDVTVSFFSAEKSFPFFKPKPKHDKSGLSEKHLRGLSFVSGKLLSSSLESLVDIPTKSHDHKHAQKLSQSTKADNRHLQIPGSNLLETKSLSSSQILTDPADDALDFSRVSPISPSCLAELIRGDGSGFLILDCRTFVCYNTNHITGALNVSCADSISRKRLLCGRATLGDLVSGTPDAKDLYKKAVENELEFMVYDDATDDIKALPITHPLKVIVICLQKAGHSVGYLQGGLEAFYKKFDYFCSKPNASSSESLQHCPPTPRTTTGDVHNAAISEILPHLYLGNESDASNRKLLRELEITHILNVTSHVPLHFEKELKCKRLPASDSGNQNLRQYFKEAIQFIDEAENKGGRVLIHCQAGVSRSATIAIVYIMNRLKKTMLEAFQFVKSKRPVVAPNFNFLGQLLDYENALNKEALKKNERSQKQEKHVST